MYTLIGYDTPAVSMFMYVCSMYTKATEERMQELLEEMDAEGVCVYIYKLIGCKEQCLMFLYRYI